MKKKFATDADGSGDSFVTVPSGTYIAEVSSLKEGEDKNGAPFWSVQLRVLSGPLDAPDPQYVGKVIFDFWSFSDNEFLENQLKHRLKCFGGTKLSQGDEVELKEEYFIGKRCRVDTVIEEYNNRKSAKVEPFGYSSLDAGDEDRAGQAATQAQEAERAEQGDIPF